MLCCNHRLWQMVDVTVTAGLITCQDGYTALFQGISDNDRLFFELRYAF